jgi:hypothetical protein
MASSQPFACGAKKGSLVLIQRCDVVGQIVVQHVPGRIQFIVKSHVHTPVF